VLRSKATPLAQPGHSSPKRTASHGAVIPPFSGPLVQSLASHSIRISEWTLRGSGAGDEARTRDPYLAPLISSALRRGHKVNRRCPRWREALIWHAPSARVAILTD
jgi:hypothetical protein